MSKKLWNTLHHNGVYFQPKYERLPTNINLFYDKSIVPLTLEQEEAATLYAKYIHTEYVQSSLFNKNFWKDFKKLLQNKKYTDFKLFDFSKIHQYLSESKANVSVEQRALREQHLDKLLEKYKYCYIDNQPQPVGNFIIEPPGLFLGRGKHPLQGCIKRRILPEDITINVSKEYKMPPPNIPGHWGQIIQNKEVLWLASWNCPVTGKVKYVYPSQASSQRGLKDMAKYELARKLKKNIQKIRKHYNLKAEDSNIFSKQLATAIYLIDNFALRVGNEKNDDEADTVGVTSLRKEHLQLLPKYQIKLDFLGKDSIRFHKVLNVEEKYYHNIQSFIENKQTDEQIFDLIQSKHINEYLQELMTGLTAKVFRTFKASDLLYEELKRIDYYKNKYYKDFEALTDKAKQNTILILYNIINVKVAELCNHQKKASVNFTTQITKLNDMIKDKKEKLNKATDPVKIQQLKIAIQEIKLKKQSKMDTKTLSIGTSKQNYIDPRITISFFKTYNLPIEKVFPKSLQDKYSWAMNVKDFIY